MHDFKTLQVFDVGYRELEKIIQESYKQRFDFVGDQESINGSYFLFRVDPALASLASIGFTREVLEFETTGKGKYITLCLLNDLCFKRLIPPGNYLISVGW